MVQGLFATEIAALIKTTGRWVRARASKENWPHKQVKNPTTKQKQPFYTFDYLPREIQQAWADANGKDLALVRNALFESRQKRETKQFKEYSEAERELALKKSQFINYFYDNALKLKRDIFLARYNSGTLDDQGREFLAGLGTISKPTLTRWLSAYNKHGLSGLCRNYHERGGMGASLTDQQKLLLKSYWLVPAEPTIRKALADIKTIHGIDIPEVTAGRYLKTIPLDEVTLKRKGSKKYRDNFEPFIRRDYTAIDVMEVACGDNRTFDFLVIDEFGRVFRPTVTVFHDVRSRMILGWYISRTANTATIMLSLEMMIEKYGAPLHILIDWGSDFNSKQFKGQKIKVFWDNGETKYSEEEIIGLFAECGIQVHNAQPYRAQVKPIERWFRTCADYFDKSMVTYVGSNTVAKPEDVSRYYGRFNNKEKLEVKLTMQELEIMFRNYVNMYNTTWKHSGQGMNGRTPFEVFQAGYKQIIPREIKPEYQPLIFSEKIPLVVHENGVRLNDLDYYAPGLINYKGRKVIARRPFRNIGKVYIYDLKGRFICEATNEAINVMKIDANQLRKIQSIRKAERDDLKKRIKDVEALQKILPTMQDYLLKANIPEPQLVKPENKQVVGANIELPAPTDEHPVQKKSNIKGLY